MKTKHRLAALGSAALLCLSFSTLAADAPPAPRLKDEMRQPWTRNDTSFIKNWQLAGPFKCKLESECADIPGGEANAGPGVTGIQVGADQQLERCRGPVWGRQRQR